MPKEYFGLDSAKELATILRQLKAQKIFLVTGKRAYHSSGASEVLDPILASYEVAIFNDFEENPKIEEVKKGIELFKQSGADVVLAVGGGSPIDMAKLINILAAQGGNPSDYIRGESKITNPDKPIIAIPTTSGTGSEATHFAVVYINGQKYSLHDDHILPDYAIVDPKLTFSLSPEITAATGMDALSQAIESYWSIQSTEESKSYSRESITLAIANLAMAVNEPTNDVRIAMSKAAHLAGKAINIAKTTAPHAISYALTSNFGVPHGHAVGVFLPGLLAYNSEVGDDDISDRRGLGYVRQTMEEIFSLLGAENADGARNKLIDLMKKIGLETRLGHLGLKSTEDIELIVNNVNSERAGNNPRALTSDFIRDLCKQLF
ncbi:MAG: phosphonoacetaldehyde reductase [bacterium]|nr:phosphonoacetaldehyde reductase [bacterium]